MAKESELLKVVDVYCSATKCRFKRDDGYYTKCHNPVVLASYKSFIGGHVHVSGCNGGCEGCTKDDCSLSAYAVSTVTEDAEDTPDELILQVEGI